MAKTTLVKKEQKELLKGEMAKPRVTGATMMKYSVFKTGLLHIHLGGHGLTVINSCNLHNNRLYCACLSHNSAVITICMYVQNIYEHFLGSWLPKVT